MGMHTFLVGFRAPDAKWKKMKAVWDACEKAGTSVPDEVSDFFGGEPPDDRGISSDLRDADCTEIYKTTCDEGFEVEIAKLPKKITHIRFYNSW